MALDFSASLFAHPLNSGLLGYVSRCDSSRSDASLSCAPEEVNQPYLNLGTHPDVVERVWKKLGGSLAEDCRWVVHRRPVLVRKSSGVIFGFATGTVYALRLAAADFEVAMANGYAQQHKFLHAVFDVSEFGPTWVFGRYKREEEDWIVRAFAYAADYAAS